MKLQSATNMNNYVKNFINLCFVNSALLITLRPAESFFGFHAPVILDESLVIHYYIITFISLMCASLTLIGAMSSEHNRKIYFEGHIGFHDLLDSFSNLNFEAAIRNEDIKKLFISGFLSCQQLKQFNYSTRTALENDEIRNLFVRGLITFEQLKKLNYNARLALEEDNIRDLFINNQLSFDQLNQFNYNARDALKINNIRDLFVNNQLSFEQLNQFNYNARDALENNDICLMFKHGHLNFDQILQCDHEIQTALNDVNNRNRLINNEITWANFYENIHPRAAQIINGTQSTHSASVHESVSDSAIALSRIYGQDISDDDVTNHISELKSKIECFSPNETITVHIHEAAKRGIDRVANIDKEFQDPKSQLSIKQLIALTQIAAKDEGYRKHTYNHYLEAIILALYEIQRGYNLNDNCIDDMSEYDDTICLSGTFNKIIEKMVGILPDCHIHFITFDIIKFKAIQLVKNLIFQFFDDRASLNLPNEDELSSLETTQRAIYIEHLKDIINSESNHEDNPLFNALNTKLLQDIQSNLEHEFGSELERHFNEDFTIEQFIDATLNSETIQTDTNTQIERYIERHQTDTNLIQNSLFQSSEQTASFEENNEFTQSN